MDEVKQKTVEAGLKDIKINKVETVSISGKKRVNSGTALNGEYFEGD